MSDFGKEFFRRILVHLSRGERVEAENFGRFIAPIVPGRKVKVIGGHVKQTGDKRVIRFRTAPKAKIALNAELEAAKAKTSKPEGEDVGR
jgi:nucleoid DNA-binding protein